MLLANSVVPPGLSPPWLTTLSQEISTVNPLGGWWFSIQERWRLVEGCLCIDLLSPLHSDCHCFVFCFVSLLLSSWLPWLWCVVLESILLIELRRFKSLPSGQPTPLLYPPFIPWQKCWFPVLHAISWVVNTHSRKCLRSVDKGYMLV